MRCASSRTVEYGRDGDHGFRVVLPHAGHVLQPDSDGAVLDHAADLAAVHVRRARLDPAPLPVAHERRRRIEAHRLRVQQRREELRRVVVPQPRRLVREQPERRRVRLREAEARERDELVVQLVRLLLRDALLPRAGDEPLAPRLERRDRALARHRAPQPFRLADREPREVDGDVEHLILEDDHAERLAQRLLEQRMVGRRAKRRVVAELLPPLDVRVHGAALDRPRPHERDLHRDVVNRLRPRAEDDLHLRAALDLEAADGVGALDLREHVLVVERRARQVDLLAPVLGDEVDALLDRRQHPEPEQVDLEEAGVGARVLVPLAHLPPLHRRGLDGDELDERARRDDHPAGVLGDVPRQAGDLGAERAEHAPAPRGELARGVGQRPDLVGDALARSSRR